MGFKFIQLSQAKISPKNGNIDGKWRSTQEEHRVFKIKWLWEMHSRAFERKQWKLGSREQGTVREQLEFRVQGIESWDF